MPMSNKLESRFRALVVFISFFKYVFFATRGSVIRSYFLNKLSFENHITIYYLSIMYITEL